MNEYERVRRRIQASVYALYVLAVAVFVGGSVLLITLLADEQRVHGYYDYASFILLFGGPYLGAASVLFGAGAIVHTLANLEDARRDDEWLDPESHDASESP